MIGRSPEELALAVEAAKRQEARQAGQRASQWAFAAPHASRLLASHLEVPGTNGTPMVRHFQPDALRFLTAHGEARPLRYRVRNLAKQIRRMRLAEVRGAARA